jgi:alkanesulfonate monooxygenase SsuD/methylene tetrahydromethanopterin reductase-like flavin-dependent oxidoreductase (luciferase family)
VTESNRERVIRRGLNHIDATRNARRPVIFVTSVGVYLPRAIETRRSIEVAREIERLGFESLWVTDHLFDTEGQILRPFPECWTMVTAIACATNNIRLGPLVLSNSFRSPTLVAKMSSTLDCICRGRLNLGIGAAWFEEEHTRYGFTLRKSPKRTEALSEALQIIIGMWTQPEFSFPGKYYKCVRAVNEPKPIQKPHPPICIGGKGGRILSIAAAFADIYNAAGPGPVPTPEEYVTLLKKLRDLCFKTGRDFRKVTKTWGGCVCVARNEREFEELVKRWHLDPNRAVVGTIDDCISKINDYEKAGMEGIMAIFPDLWDSGSLEMATLFADAILNKV